MGKAALLIVDVQSGGNLGGGMADKVVPVINDIRSKNLFDVVVVVQDWHPEGHVSFQSTHGEKARLYTPFTLPSGYQQMMWPDHALQNSPEAELHPGLKIEESDFFVKKGTDINRDSYSAFFDNERISQTPLHEYLKKNQVTDVYIVGLALDWCVSYTALDAALLGYNTFLVRDATESISPKWEEQALERLSKSKVKLIQSQDIKLSSYL